MYVLGSILMIRKRKIEATETADRILWNGKWNMEWNGLTKQR
jgi:hypothetical protein